LVDVVKTLSIQTTQTMNQAISQLSEKLADQMKEMMTSQAKPVGHTEKSGDPGKSEQQKTVRTCYHCQKPGHIKKDCRKWQSDQKKFNNRQGQQHQQFGNYVGAQQTNRGFQHPMQMQQYQQGPVFQQQSDIQKAIAVGIQSAMNALASESKNE